MRGSPPWGRPSWRRGADAIPDDCRPHRIVPPRSRRDERHKGGLAAPRTMDDAGPTGGSASADSDAPLPLADVLWEAAGDAMMWKAMMHEHAAMAWRRKAWAAEAKSNALMGRAARKCGRAVDAHGRMDTDAVMRVIPTMKRAARLRVRASRALAQSSDLCEASGSEQKMASEAFMRSTDPEHAVAVYKVAVGAYEHAVEGARGANRAIDGARNILENANRLADGAIRTLVKGGGEPGNGDELSSIQADMREHAGRAQQASAAARRRLNKEGKTVARLRRLAAAASKASSAAAEAAAEAAKADGRRGGPGVQEAEAAWRRAAAEAASADAATADAAHRDGRRARGGGPDRTA